MTYPSVELKTKAELVEKYNSTERRFSNGTQGEFARRGVHVLTNDEYHLGPEGEARWNSSDNIIPGDILEMAVVDGTISIELRNKTEEVRIVDDAKFFEQYRNMRAKYGYSEEEKAEMRIAFAGELEGGVFDIVTGQRIAL